jgi:hypothetical protein
MICAEKEETNCLHDRSVNLLRKQVVCNMHLMCDARVAYQLLAFPCNVNNNLLMLPKKYWFDDKVHHLH